MNGKDPKETECKKKETFCGWAQDNEKLIRLACMPKKLNVESLKFEYEVDCVNDTEKNIMTCLCNTDNCNYQCNECKWKKSVKEKILKCENADPNCEARSVLSTKVTKGTEASGSVTTHSTTPAKTSEDRNTKTTNSNGAIPADNGSTKYNGKIPEREQPDSPESDSGCQRIAEPSQVLLIIWILATFITTVDIPRYIPLQLCLNLHKYKANV